MKLLSNTATQVKHQSTVCASYSAVFISTLLASANVNSTELIDLPSATTPFKLANQAEFASGRIIIQSAPGVSTALLNNILGNHGVAQIASKMSVTDNPLPTAQLVSVPKGQEQAMVKQLSLNPNIAFVELDRLVKPQQITPNDTYYERAWHLTALGAQSAWEVSYGENVVVAVLDSGVYAEHADLAINMVPGWNVRSNNSDTSDIFGHGTKVAGVVAAHSDNNEGVTSIAWHASIMPVRVTDNSQHGGAYVSDIAKGIRWASDNGADIANISFAVSTSPTISQAAQYMREQGGMVVISSGNDSKYIECSANPSIITVGATKTSHRRAGWSNYGNCVDVVAPGTAIWTTTKSGGYSSQSGTSYAAPATAAVLALIKAANPNLSVDEIEAILKQSANKEFVDGDYSTKYGYGRVDARAAVELAYQAPEIDQEAPTVSIVSATSAQQALDNTHSIKVEAQDNMSVAYVELFANGELVGTDNQAPYQFIFASGKFAQDNPEESDVVLKAYAYDVAENQGESSQYKLALLKLVVDEVKPQIQLTQRLRKRIARRVINIAASATDNIEVTNLQLFIDNKLVHQTDDGSFNFKWNAVKESLGVHRIQIKAFDAAGNVKIKNRKVVLRKSKQQRLKPPAHKTS